MKPKKTSKADLNNKRGLFFQIGLISSLLLMILFFSYSQPAVSVQTLEYVDIIEVIDLPPITMDKPEDTPPAQPRVVVISDLINIIENERKLENPYDAFDVNDDEIVFGPIAMPGSGKPEDLQDEIIDFILIEDKPLFQGKDLTTFRIWVNQHLRYPEVAEQNGIQGRVTIQFIIDREGNLTDITVLSSPDRSLADEAVRVLKSSERWTPGKQRGRPVPVRFTIPIDFRLQ